MDFASQAMLELLEKFPHIPQHKYTTAWGEPWTFGVPDRREREFFLECGLQLRETVSFFRRDAAKRYLTRADGTMNRISARRIAARPVLDHRTADVDVPHATERLVFGCGTGCPCMSRFVHCSGGL